MIKETAIEGHINAAGIASAIMEEMLDGLNDQPYSVACSVCGDTLFIKKTLDCDNDLILEIDPCEKCMEDAKEPRP